MTRPAIGTYVQVHIARLGPVLYEVREGSCDRVQLLQQRTVEVTHSYRDRDKRRDIMSEASPVTGHL